MSTTFRAAPINQTVDDNLGLIAELRGNWLGHGFNLIARPDQQDGQPFFLELNATRESLAFTAIGGDIPNRGSAQGDVTLHGLHYLQQVADLSTDTGIHIEPGLWIRVPPTTVPSVAQDTYVRQAAIPHGDSLLAQSITAVSLDGGPIIASVDSTPFTGTVPQLNASSPTPETDPAYLAPYLNDQLPAGLDPGLVAATTIKDPTRVLQAEISKQLAHGHQFVSTVVIQLSTAPVGGIVNIPFVAANANAAQLDAIFWIETVTHPVAGTFVQLQYVQRVILDFIGIRWPHFSVATLRKL